MSDTKEDYSGMNLLIPFSGCSVNLRAYYLFIISRHEN